jgi:hypothetical protein
MSEDQYKENVAGSTKPLLSGPKRQHFLPRFYLEGFCKDEMIAVYDRKSNEIRVQTPQNTGVIGHFYTLEDDQGRKRFELEQMLSEFESKASLVIELLAARKEISPDQRADLAIFIALASFRTPEIIDSLKQMNSGLIGDMARRMYSDVNQVKESLRGKPGSPLSEEDLEQEAKEMVEFIQGGQYEIETKHQWAVGMAMQMAFKIAPILSGRDWFITHRDNEKKSFITTDAPVTLTTIEPRQTGFWAGIGFANPDAMVIFPMTQTCTLVMCGRDGDFQHRSASAEQMRHHNLMMADRCQRFLIGRDAALLRSLADDLGLPKKQWQPKMKIHGR